jgi:hypothetical protein
MARSKGARTGSVHDRQPRRQAHALLAGFEPVLRKTSMVLETRTKLPLSYWLRERPGLRSFIAIRAADELASQMLNVAIGWYVYAATHDPMSLAYVGLAQFLPLSV